MRGSVVDGEDESKATSTLTPRAQSNQSLRGNQTDGANAGCSLLAVLNRLPPVVGLLPLAMKRHRHV